MYEYVYVCFAPVDACTYIYIYMYAYIDEYIYIPTVPPENAWR